LKVIVDTSAWSQVLRHAPAAQVVREIERLVRHGRVQMLGVIRQELLSGIPVHERFEQLKDKLSQFMDLPVMSEDHEYAASTYNACRAKGIQGNVVDMLICAMAIRNDMSIYSLDRDFIAYARCVPLELHAAGR
jgi:predicted nucleic acid-binding protein